MVSVFLWLNVKRFQGGVNTHGRSGAARKNARVFTGIIQQKPRKSKQKRRKKRFFAEFRRKKRLSAAFPGRKHPGEFS